jgi:hypothetical protein
MQQVYTVAELQAAGLAAGPITAMAFNITTLGDAATNSGMVIMMGSTSLTTLTAFVATTGFTTVFPSQTYTHSASGIQTIPFSTPYVWDGTSNIIFDMVQNGANSTNNSITLYTATAGNTVAYTATASSNSASLSTNRLNTTFTGVASSPATAYSWTDGTTTVGTTNPLTVSPTSTTTYTATVTASGCTVNSNAVTVTTIALPAGPGANNSTQCGTAVPAAFVTGAAPANFRWYSAQTGGTLLQTGGATYTSSISVTTHFWVSITNGTCESLRTDVVATVAPADPVLASVDLNNVCANTVIHLSAANIAAVPANTYTYSWNASPLSGSGLSGATPGNPLSVTPTTAGTYTYTVTATDVAAGCITTSPVTVTVKALPVISSATATPSTVCAGVSSSLFATSNSTAVNTVQVGSGATVLGASTTVGAFYCSYYGNGRSQMLFKASELTALGFVAGNLTAASIDISALSGGNVTTMTGFTIKLKNVPTSVTALAAYETGATTVYGPTNYLVTTGTNTHTFTTPFLWDGTSNVVLEICFATGLTGTTGSHKNTYTTTTFNSFINYQADGSVADPCSNVTVTNTSTSRPNVKFTGLTGTLGPVLNYTWQPGALTGATVSVTPATTTIYTVTGTDPSTSCTSTPVTVTLTVNPLPPAPSANNGTDQCGTGLSDMSVSSNNVTDPQAPPFFKWYSASTGGTLLQSGTSTTYTTPISVSADFWVSEVSVNGCEGPRSEITSVVSEADLITASVSPVIVCLGGSTALLHIH